MLFIDVFSLEIMGGVIKINRNDSKIFIVISFFVIAFLVFSPILLQFLQPSQTDFFTEMWLLGPDKEGENYPCNITTGETYSVFLGINNNLEYDASYKVQVKFRNLTQSAPDVFNPASSSLIPVYEFSESINVGHAVEMPIVFSFNYLHLDNESKIIFQDLVLNDKILSLEGSEINWNYQNQMFFGNLIFELWIYDDQLGSYQYCEQYVDLKLVFQV